MLIFSKSFKIIVSVIVAIGIFATLLAINLEQSQPDEIQSNITAPNFTATKIKSTQEEYEYNLENSKNAKLMPGVPIDKMISPGHVFGFIPDNGLETGMSVITLSNPDEKLSIRFTSKFSGDLTKLHLYFDNQKNIKVRVGIQEDIEGFPSGQWVGNSIGNVEKILNSEKKKV